MSPKAPKEISGYLFGKKLGAGATGAVYAVTKPDQPELCCKVIPKESLPTELDLHLFQNEIKALSTLSHPNVVQYIELIEDNNNYYLFMEKCSGMTLQSYITRFGLLSEDLVSRIAQQIFSVLAYIHSKGVAHRDIKPDNILISKDHRIKFIDFGLSTTNLSTLRSTFCGTLAYAAPECIEQRPYFADKSDVWSAGIVLFQMATGKFPWTQIQNIPKLITEITTQSIKIPPEINPYVNSVLEAVLRTNPAIRPPAADVLLMPLFKQNRRNPRVRSLTLGRNSSCPEFPVKLPEGPAELHRTGSNAKIIPKKPITPRIVKVTKRKQLQRAGSMSARCKRPQETGSSSPLVDNLNTLQPHDPNLLLD